MRELMKSHTGIVVEYGDPEDPSERKHRAATAAAYDNTAPGFLHILEGGETIAVYPWDFVLAITRLKAKPVKDRKGKTEGTIEDLVEMDEEGADQTDDDDEDEDEDRDEEGDEEEEAGVVADDGVDRAIGRDDLI